MEFPTVTSALHGKTGFHVRPHSRAWQDIKSCKNRWVLAASCHQELQLSLGKRILLCSFWWAYRRMLHHTDHWKILGRQLLAFSRWVLTSSAILGCMKVFEFKVSRSFDSSWKALPRSFISPNNFYALTEEDFWDWLVCSWCVISSFATLASDANSYCDISSLTSGPDTVHLLIAAGSPVSPMELPSPFTTALACSCAWSMAKPENSVSLMYHKIYQLKFIKDLRVSVFQSDHVSKMDGKPSGIVYIVVCKEQGNESSQYFSIKTEVGLPERPDQWKCHQFYWQHKIPEFKLRTLFSAFLTPVIKIQSFFILFYTMILLYPSF